MEATQQLMIGLEVRQWNDVVEALNNAPFRIAAPLIQEIVRQHNEAEMRAQAAKETGPDIEITRPTPRTNGAAASDHQMR
jgi:hypothetical protein